MSCEFEDKLDQATKGMDITAGQKVLLDCLKLLNSSMVTQFTGLCDKLEDYSKQMKTMSNDLAEANIKIAETETAVSQLKTENSRLKSQLKLVNEKCVKIEAQSRRENLIFSGVDEHDSENCEEKIRFIMTKEMNVPDDITIERCHRLGPLLKGLQAKKPRNIIVKFSFFKDRQSVWSKRSLLKTKKYKVFEDFPDEIRHNRDQLKPALQKAISLNKSAYLVADRLIVDNRTYTVENMMQLPAEINPCKLATPSITGELVGFFGAASPLSNFHRAPFEIDGTNFAHVEQYYQYERAKYYGDAISAQNILAMTSPYQCYFASKRVNRPVDVTSDDIWLRTRAQQVMQRGCLAKFQQNAGLGRFLLNTGKKSLVEANAKDQYWGAGISLTDPRLAECNHWTGKNNLGLVLEQVRTKLRN
jgi:ribA/ribD-fused uncharacterized protein